MPTSDSDFKTRIAELRRQKDDAVSRATRAFEESAAVIVTEKGSAPELYILSGNMGGGKDSHRITFFMKDGPRGHHEGSIPELMEWIASSGTAYKPVGDAEVIAWTSTDEFNVGSRRVAYVQALNKLGYLMSKAAGEDKAALQGAYDRAQRMEDVEAATAFMERTIASHSPRKNPARSLPSIEPIERSLASIMGIAGYSRSQHWGAPDPTVKWWSQRDEAAAGKRDYAKVNLDTGVIYVSPRLASLDLEHRHAILAHELGHLVSNDMGDESTESQADRAASDYFQIPIEYDKAFPGKGLQTCAVRTNPALELREEDFELVPNPTPWVTNLLSAHYTELEDQVPPAWLPKISKTKAVGTTFTGELAEFGCGAFGCVLPTLDPAVVLKVTSDESEAEFAIKLADTLPTAVCTAYFLVIDLVGKTRGPRSGVRTDGRGAKVYLLWREEAKDVGKIDKVVGQHAERAIHAQHTAAMEAFIAMQNGQDARDKLVHWENACDSMGALVPELAFVSDGLLRAYREKGVFISDVHGGNLGRCMRNGSPTWVITDPGNVVVMPRASTAARRRSR